MRGKVGLVLIILIQSFLIHYAFKPFFESPKDFLLYNYFDGIRNYYALEAYLQQTEASELLKFDQMNYPYGDYIFYADATPAIAVLLKIFGVRENGLAYFNAFLLLSIIFSSWLCFLILKRFISNRLLLFALSLCLPWVNPQIIRFSNGHMNLALSFLLLLVLYIMMRMYEARQDGFSVKLAILLVATIFFASWCHFYYLPILGVICGIFGLWWIIDAALKGGGIVNPILSGLAIPVLSAALVFISISVFDGYFSIRSDGAQGFNYEPWKLSFSSLWTPYSFFNLDLFNQAKQVPYESNSYLGNFALLTGAFLLIFRVFFSSSWKSIFQAVDSRPIFGILLAGLVSLSISIGTKYTIHSLDFTFTNILNPFYYLNKVTDMGTHFRCLGRFNWFFFWAINIFLAFYLSRLSSRNIVAKIVAVVLVLFLAVDARDMIKFYTKNDFVSQLKQEEKLSIANKLIEGVDLSKYQAIIPIPFYHVGSENYTYTIDPKDDFMTKTMQLSLVTKLPLVSAKVGRIPEQFAIKQINIFVDPSASSLQDMPNKKPFLVLLSKAHLKLINDNPAFDGVLRSLIDKQNDLIASGELKALKAHAGFELMEWRPIE